MQSLPNGTILGEYTLIRLIGRGGMGEVYEAHEAKLSRRVALKIIAPSQPDQHDQEDLFRRFIQEARTLAQVNHPNVVTIYNIDRIGAAQFIAMEYVPGLSLKQLQKESAIHFEEAIPVFAQILEGLGSLHDSHIIHRDLKPHNILVRRDGQVKILDFGIAKQMLPGLGEGTSVGVIAGTLPYMAPEVRIGEPAHPGSDIWSLGAIFYEMLVGRPLARVLLDHPKATDIPFSNEDRVRIPEELRQIIRKMCATNPKERYSRTSQVADDIKKFRQSRPTPPPEVYESFVKRVAAATEREIREAGGDISNISIKSTPLPTDLKVAKDRRKLKRQRKSVFGDYLPLAGLAGVILAVVLGWWSLRKPSPVAITPAPLPIPAPIAVTTPTPAPPPPPAPVAAPAPTGALALLEPKDLEVIWLEPNDRMAFSWTHPLSAKDYEIQISRDSQFKGKLLSVPVNGNSYRPEEELPEGIFFWRLKPTQSWAPATGPHRFLLSYLRPVTLVSPKPDETFLLKGLQREANLNFQWQCKPGVKSYRVQLSQARDFSSVLNEEFVSICQMKDIRIPAGSYYWRVGILPKENRDTLWSEPEIFVVERPQAPAPRPERELEAPKLRTSLVRYTLSFKGQPRDLASLQKNLVAPPVLRWSPVKGANGYLVQFSPNRDFTTLLSEERVREPQLAWRNVIPGKTFFRVRALSSTDKPSPASGRGLIDASLPAPTLPSQIKHTAVPGDSGALIKWPALPLAAQYLVKLGRKADLSQTPAVPVEVPEYVAQVETGTYYLRVAAADSDGEDLGPYSSATQIVVSQGFSLDTVKILTPKSGARAPATDGRLSVKFSWTPIKGAESYQMELSSDENFSTVIQRARTTQPFYLLKQAELGGRVYWRVRAESSKGLGDWSPSAYFEVR